MDDKLFPLNLYICDILPLVVDNDRDNNLYSYFKELIGFKTPSFIFFLFLGSFTLIKQISLVLEKRMRCTFWYDSGSRIIEN